MQYQTLYHGLWTPNEGINQRNLKISADVADIPPVEFKVINVGSDTFGNPIFQKGLQN